MVQRLYQVAKERGKKSTPMFQNHGLGKGHQGTESYNRLEGNIKKSVV